jgi:DNA transformation protein and related proteins
MPAPPGLVDHCLELLGPLGAVSARPMFGGHGLRIDGHFMALIAFDRLYLKVDAVTRPQFEAAGCEPFVYEAKGKAVAMSYWTVPAQAMESPMGMQPWARLALDAALRASVSKRSVAAPRPRATSPARPASKTSAPAATRARKSARGRG